MRKQNLLKVVISRLERVISDLIFFPPMDHVIYRPYFWHTFRVRCEVMVYIGLVRLP